MTINPGLYYVYDRKLVPAMHRIGETKERLGYAVLLPRDSKHIELLMRSYTDLAEKHNALVSIEYICGETSDGPISGYCFRLVDYVEV